MTEQGLNVLIDALVEELTVPVAVLVIDDPWLDEAVLTRLDGPLPELPAWSPQTVALVEEFEAMGGAR
ncbi:hypothetical protein ACIRRH_41335 [Kitasatospora sp. NPDC101235]|uniref:hypothetical protein n=1 Tax=Kitasatospora sp. NPDC101235 TaxID=3364101 RepID=UPI003802A797